MSAIIAHIPDQYKSSILMQFMSQKCWRVRYYTLRIGWCKSKIVCSCCDLKNTIEWLNYTCLFTVAVVVWWDPDWNQGRILIYFSKVRISFNMLATHGPSKYSVLVLTWPKNVKDVFCESCLYYTSKPKQLSGARRVLVQSHDNQFPLISCHPETPKAFGNVFSAETF